MSKGSLEGVYPGLIMANGARMEGIEAMVFFTFFGLNALHKKKMNVWPWGDEWNKEFCNSAESRMERTRVVGRYIKGISPEWCHDMAGNVYEWCVPNIGEEREDGYKVLKGGGFRSSREECMVASRQWADPGLQEPDIGFRVVRAREH